MTDFSNPSSSPLTVDIIGDVHGHADRLHELLHELGYRPADAAWHHPAGRKAVFVGDLINGGPDSRGVLQTVAGMQEAGSAACVMGNHEYNALLHYLPGSTGRPLRLLTEKQWRSHEPTFRQLAGPHPEEWAGWLRWMLNLPLWLDAGPFRVVHACWDHEAMAFLIQSRLTPTLLEASVPEGATRQAVENLLKGPVLTELPDGAVLPGPIRLRWWDPPCGEAFLEEISVDKLPRVLRGIRIAGNAFPDRCPAETGPLFIGHYPKLGGDSLQVSRSVICVDAGVSHGGKLAAWRLDEGVAVMV